MDDSISSNVPHSNLSGLPNTSGIYKITCTANKRFYIGSTVNLHNRKVRHFGDLQRNNHDNPHLQRAWNKYGEQAFIFEVLEFVLPMSLTAREQYWFNKLKPFGKKGFNIATEAGSNLGVKKTPEQIERTRQSLLGKKHPPERVEKNRQVNLGRKMSPETCKKMSQARIGRPGPTLGKKFTPETKAKMRQAQLGKKMSPEAIEKTRQANLGRKRTPEAIEKNRQVNIGKKMSPEAKAKISQASLGKKKSPKAIENMRQAQQARRKREESNLK